MCVHIDFPASINKHFPDILLLNTPPSKFLTEGQVVGLIIKGKDVEQKTVPCANLEINRQWLHYRFTF